jgi:crotonobetainyl-CoA:carnitine CoA-transferase CaiB-like acyl-CoA transferase
MRNWGMDYESLIQIKSDIIAVSMSGFGHTGPQKDYVSYGPTLQALSGYTLLMRQEGHAPAGWGYSYADMSGGYSGALAVLMALWYRRRTGHGQFVDLSQFETISSVIGPAMLDIMANGTTLAPFSNRSQEAPAAPHGVYRCAGEDRWCAITIFTEDEWRAFCHVLGNPVWTTDTRFATLGNRLQHQAALDRHVEEWTCYHTPEEVMTKLQHGSVAAGLVANGADMDHDPQLQARGYWAQVRTPEGDTVTLDGPPIKLSATPGAVAAPGPFLGEQTESVLRRLLNYTDADIAHLKAERVVAGNAEIVAERQAKS